MLSCLLEIGGKHLALRASEINCLCLHIFMYTHTIVNLFKKTPNKFQSKKKRKTPTTQKNLKTNPKVCL